MIYGIGIDIVRIQRMRDAHKKWGRKFFEKFLTGNEIAYCYEKKEPYPSISVRFAAKEALIKAIGSEVHVNMKDVEIVNSENGRPWIKVLGRLEKFFNEKEIRSCHLSLSHEKEYGVACVVLEC
ncbi:MAG TPA: holo-[acyl-carrier-protein] synthase [Nitrospirae bacterium]|nr:holo-[acyl-carrier-protein] synthase [Nitrospirota bacterium]